MGRERGLILSRLGALVGALLVGSLAAGCGDTMEQADCDRVSEHLREVWDAETQKTAPDGGEVAERAQAVIRTEREKLVSDWQSECEKELMGRRVDREELDCLLEAETISAIQQCGKMPAKP